MQKKLPKLKLKYLKYSKKAVSDLETAFFILLKIITRLIKIENLPLEMLPVLFYNYINFRQACKGESSWLRKEISF